jgi:hypothetical protein
MAGDAMLLIQRRGIGGGGGKCEQSKQRGNSPRGAADAEKTAGEVMPHALDRPWSIVVSSRGTRHAARGTRHAA